MATKAETIQHWRDMIANNQAWAGRALIRIAAEQTASERAEGVTALDNGVGFSANDAFILTSFADQLEARGTLSPKQWALVHKRMPRYAAQLYRLTHSKVS